MQTDLNSNIPPPPPTLHTALWDSGAPLNHRYGLSTPVQLWSHSCGIPRYTTTPSLDNWSFHRDYISVWVIMELFQSGDFKPGQLVRENFKFKFCCVKYFNNALTMWHCSERMNAYSLKKESFSPGHTLPEWTCSSISPVGLNLRWMPGWRLECWEHEKSL